MARPKPPPRPVYLRPAQVAELLQVDVKTINRYAKDGKLAHVLTFGGYRRYEAAHIREFAAELTHQVGRLHL